MITIEDPVDQQALDILIDAFRDDPVLAWIKDAPAFIPEFFRILMPVFVDKGLTYIDPQGRGAAAWLGPDHKLDWPLGPAKLWKMAGVCGPGGLLRLALGSAKTEKYHPSEPHYYLFVIGARSCCQGQGVGSALISHLLRRCDREQLPAYLENSREANLDFYQGHGFRVKHEIRFARKAPPVWLMWREPQAPATVRGGDSLRTPAVHHRVAARVSR